jgi:hypothetical protein
MFASVLPDLNADNVTSPCWADDTMFDLLVLQTFEEAGLFSATNTKLLNSELSPIFVNSEKGQ